MKWTSLLGLYDVFLTFLPSALATLTALKVLEEHSIMPPVIGFVVLLILLATLLFNNHRKRRSAISEILAIGYFMNFIEQLADNLTLQTPVYVDGDTKPKTVSMHDIAIKVFMPRSTEGLATIAATLNNASEYAVVHIKNQKTGTPIWARAERNTTNTLVLVDVPRTLFALPDYIKKDVGGGYSTKDSIRLYRTFREKIRELLAVPHNEILTRVEIVDVP